MRDLLLDGAYGKDVAAAAQVVRSNECFGGAFDETERKWLISLAAGLVSDAVPFEIKSLSYEQLRTLIGDLVKGDISGKAMAEMAEVLNEIAGSSQLLDAEVDRLLGLIQEKTGSTKSSLAKDLRVARVRVGNLRIAARQAADAKGAAERGEMVTPILAKGWARHVNGDGMPLRVTPNLELLLSEAKMGVGFNEMKLREEYTGTIAASPQLCTTDSVVQIVADWALVNEMLNVSSSNMIPMIRLIAKKYSFHPFFNFLESLRCGAPWDGIDRLRGPLGLFGSIVVPQGKEPLRDQILQRWLFSVIAAARHLYKNRIGLQPRGVLVFSGEQYTGKTTWLGKLFEGLFPESKQCFLSGTHYTGTADSKLELLAQVVTELGEIDATTKRTEAALLKAFLSGDCDRIRRPYGVDHHEFERRTVFAGTVNEEFLRDNTGNTRFWTIPTLDFDFPQQAALDMKQIWAQIDRECLLAWGTAPGPTDPVAPWLFTREEMKGIEGENEEHRVLGDAEVWLLDHFDWDDPDWCQGGNFENRRTINPLTLTEITILHGRSSRRNIASQQWISALRRLTKQAGACRTTRTLIEMVPDPGQSCTLIEVKNRQSGRYWAMPPEITPKIVKADDASDKDEISPSTRNGRKMH